MNGKDVRGATHQDAVMALIAPTYEIILDIRHDPPPPGLKVSHLKIVRKVLNLHFVKLRHR